MNAELPPSENEECKSQSASILNRDITPLMNPWKELYVDARTLLSMGVIWHAR